MDTVEEVEEIDTRRGFTDKYRDEASALFLNTNDARFSFSSQGSRRPTFDLDLQDMTMSRRPSASTVMAAIRRPSQAIALSASQAIMAQRRIVMELLQGGASNRSLSVVPGKDNDKAIEYRRKNRRIGRDGLSIVLSALYAKFIVVLGVSLPVSEILSGLPPTFYQGFYLYLYVVSVAFVLFMYGTLIRERAVSSIINSYQEKVAKEGQRIYHQPVVRHGSFYLRLGAIAFGIGSMVYTGLEFGQYFELHSDPVCSNVLVALTPAARMLLTIVQMQFIFLNTRDMRMGRHKVVARFGVMHMVATNLCEWLYVLVVETKHEIVHLAHSASLHMATDNTTKVLMNASALSHHVTKRALATHIVIECRRTNIMGSLVQNASPFLFPCTIEYSLICAVILFEMWKKIKPIQDGINFKKDYKRSESGDRGEHSFSVDCASAHRGLFAGILIIVFTIISLIMFFVLNGDPLYMPLGVMEMTVCEIVLYTLTAVAIVAAMFQMRDMKYCRKLDRGLGLDNTLLLLALSGVFIYGMFSIIALYFATDPRAGRESGLVAEVFGLVQASVQTMFVLDACSRRSRGSQQARRKPGREIVTFLLVANMAMWFLNTLVKNRAEFRISHLQFFGTWAWTIITHVSMPLVIFYRFHSTICLFEIWKSAYKVKPNM